MGLVWVVINHDKDQTVNTVAGLPLPHPPLLPRDSERCPLFNYTLYIRFTHMLCVPLLSSTPTAHLEGSSV